MAKYRPFSLASETWIAPHDQVAQGWSAFARDNYPAAQDHFALAAGAMPVLDEACIGLRASISSTWWPYRLVRRAVFRVKAESTGHRTFQEGISWWVFSAGAGAIGALVKGAEADKQYLWPVTATMFAAYVLLKMIQYVAVFRVRQHRLGELAVGNRALGVLGGLPCLFLLLASLIAYVLIGHFAAIIAAVALVTLIRPMEEVFSVRAGAPRQLMSTYLLLAAAMGTALVADTVLRLEGHSWSEPIGGRNGALILGLIFVSVLAGTASRVASGIGAIRRGAMPPSRDPLQGESVHLSDQKLRRFHGELYGIRAALYNLFCSEGEPTTTTARRLLGDQLLSGHESAAVVVSEAPLIVAAYLEDLERVLLLKFDRALASEYSLRVGSRLLAVYHFLDDGEKAADLYPVNGESQSSANVWTLIADFLSDDDGIIGDRKNRIGELLWTMAAELGEAAIQQSESLPRDSRPFCSFGSVDDEDAELSVRIDRGYRQLRRHS